MNTGSIQLENGEYKFFTASTWKKALGAAMEALGLRSLTRRNLKKAQAIAIHFGGYIIYPVNRKRTLDKRRNRFRNRSRLVLARIERFDLERRRGNVHRRQQRVAA